MQGGDIDNGVPMRLLVIFNGFLGTIPNKFGSRANLYRKMHRWDSLLDLYEFDDLHLSYVHDLTFRRGLQCDVAIIEEKGIVKPLKERFNDLAISVSRVRAVRDAREVRDSLAAHHEIAYVIHGNPDWSLAFGKLGRYGMSV